ncbi:MAG: glutamate--tRNA ligase [Planctomycetota bacterium]|nr:MAG: glutamate--tRNA ligase [Planctomycetota bacterium]
MAFQLPAGPARVRVAPSPTGDPHVGTAYVALFNKAVAVRTGGQFILRIEDTDRSRYVEGAERMIFEALRWLGLDYDEGPDVGGPCAPYRQSERTALYREAAERLLATGKAYRCFCTPERLAELRAAQRRDRRPPGYDGRCRALAAAEVERLLAAGTPWTVRLAVPRTGTTRFEDGLRGPIQFENSEIDDQVLLKSDGHPTYHLANVVDDHAMRITHVIRAEEWISSTPKHVLLYEAFGWPPPVFVHLPLLRNADRSKISKRKNPVSLLWYREQGFLPEALLNFLALMGHSMPDEREIFSLEEFYAEFDPGRLKTTGPVFDLAKLQWLNGEWIRRLPPQEFVRRVLAHHGEPYARRPELVARVAPLVQPRIRTLAEWPSYADTFFRGCSDYEAALLVPKPLDAAMARQLLEQAQQIAARAEPFAAAVLEQQAREAVAKLGCKVGPAFMVLRVAITGARVSPPLFESMEVLGREETLARLQAALAKLATAEATGTGS